MIKNQKPDSLNRTFESELEKLSQKAASLLLGISVTTIIDWRKSGKIPRDAYMRIGRPIFYSKKKLLEYARNNRSISKNSK